MPKLPLRLLTFCLSFLLISAARLHAAELADIPAFSLSGSDLQQKVSQQTTSAHTAGVVLVDDEVWVFRPDSTIERTQHVIYKVLDSAGVQSMGGIQQRWEPWHEQRPVVRARVVTPDGAPHELDPKSLVEAAAGSTGPLEYSDLKVLQGPLPAVQVGSVVEYQVSQSFTPVLGSLAFRGYVAGGSPVRFSRLRVEYPTALPFHYSTDLCPDAKEVKEVKDGVVHLTVTFGAFEPLKTVEPLLPFDAPRVPSVTMSTGASWNALAKIYGEVVDKQIADAPVKDLVSGVSGKNSERLAVISQLVRALHREVRYTGVEFADAAIVPAKPADTLARKYGDCKDKASLLVAMLRSAGVPAYVALLNAGLEQDVNPQHPGLGLFNHAIVYVPGSPDLWIDATAEHMAVGLVPVPDEGRLALIVRPETSALVKIPDSPASANVTTTFRDYTLPDFGPAHISQSLVGAGTFDGSYRDVFAYLDNDEFRKAFEKQTQAEWDTKTAIAVTHQPLDDYKTPFKISMDIRDAKRVTVTETGAAITLEPSLVLGSLPNYFGTEEKSDEDPADKKPPRTQGYVLPVAFVQKLSCQIQIPDGFALKQLPVEEKRVMGPATYTAHYEMKDGVVHAELAFDSGKRVYSLAEGQALRSALIEFLKQPLPALTFQPAGQTLLDQGHYREALSSFQKLVSQHNTEAVNHIRLSRAYLAIGCGEQARKEAKYASDSAPKFTAAWRNLAFVYEHDLIGRKYRTGWDPAEVERALRQAMALDADDASIPSELAGAFEYDATGVRYGSAERLGHAIQIYKEMGDDKVEQQGDQDTFLWDLAFIGDLDDLSKKLDRFGAAGSRATYRAFLTALRQGGTKAANDLQASSSPEELKVTEPLVGHLLSSTAHYQEAADFATVLGSSNVLPGLTPDALRSTHHVDEKTLHADKPDDLLCLFVSATLKTGETPATLQRFWSSTVDPQIPAALIAGLQRSNRLLSGRSGVDPWVTRDVTLSHMKLTVEANPDSGFRVRAIGQGAHFWMAVVPEAGGLRFIGDPHFADGIGKRVLADVAAGKLEAARKWLDWVREDVKVMSEDDPLGGPIFPRIWNKGAPATEAQIRYAAATLISTRDALPVLREAIKTATDETVKNYYRLAFTFVAERQKEFAESTAEAKLLVAAYPSSNTALNGLVRAYLGLGQPAEAEKLVRTALANDADDSMLKRQLANILAERKDWAGAQAVARETAESPNANAIDWNQYGWIALLAGEADEEKIHQVERAMNQPNDAMQQTIASMYAEVGNLSEARRLSLDALDKFGYDTPNDSWWYVFGRIAEQVGARLTAIQYYEEVKPDAEAASTLSTYNLVQKRLALVKAAAGAS